MCKLPPVEKSGAALDISTRDIFPKILKLAEQGKMAGIFGDRHCCFFARERTVLAEDSRWNEK